jgi:hypothetical protein
MKLPGISFAVPSCHRCQALASSSASPSLVMYVLVPAVESQKKADPKAEKRSLEEGIGAAERPR